MASAPTLISQLDSKQPHEVKRTRRSEIFHQLTADITRKKSAETYRMESEYELMARFAVSRVTVRLALADLEHNGLVYRERGRGTYVRGWSAQVRKTLAIMLNVHDAFAVRNVVDFMEGVAAAQTSEGASVFISSSSPSTWNDGVIAALAGVLIVGDPIETEELVALKSHRVTYLVVSRNQLDTRGNCVDLGKEVGAALYSYALTGKDLPSDYLTQEVSYAVPRGEAETRKSLVCQPSFSDSHHRR